MSDFMYKWVVRIGYHAFRVSSRPVALHRERLDEPEGAFILAANHLSPYDVPCLMAQMPRWKLLDFVSITELFQNRLTAWFLRSVNAFPLDRGKVDGRTVRIILDRLARGRIIAMFPEGGFRTPADSVLSRGPIKPGVASLAQLAGVPIIPCVILGTNAYSRFTSWLPLKRVCYGVNFGKPLYARTDVAEEEARARLVQELKRSYRALHTELLAVMGDEERKQWEFATAPAAAQQPAPTAI